jgi:4'-phosphopantetheinyl transferase
MQMPIIQAGFIDGIKWQSGRVGVSSSPCLDVYRLFLTANKSALAPAMSVLSAQEVERAQHYRNAYDTERFMLCRAALRCLLAQYVGTSARGIRFIKDAQGKPYAEGLSVRFNVAHSGDIALLAFSDDHIGIDVERIDTSADYTLVMDSCFNAGEQHYVKESDGPLKQFYKLWTRKEAIVKATGKGIEDEIVDVPVLDGKTQVSSSVIGSEKNWMVDSFEAGENYVGSVAYAREHTTVRFFDYSLEGCYQAQVR